MNCKDGTDHALRQRQFRTAMGMYPTGVTLVATRQANGKVLALTINSFHSVSLQPLLVSWNLSRRSQWHDVFLQCSHYTVNVLAAEQVELARQFARRAAPQRDGASWRWSVSGQPLLDGAVAHFECANVQNHVAGDHTLFVGQVIGFDSHAKRAPLLFFAGNYCSGRTLQAPGLR